MKVILKILKITGLTILAVVLVVVVVFAVAVTKNYRKLKKEMTEVQTIELTEDGYYESEYGWKMKPVVGWGKVVNTPSKMEMLLPADKKAGDEGWTYVAVEPFARAEEVDKGGFLKKYEEVLLGSEMFPNAELVEESTEGKWKGAISYDYLFDHDYQEGIRLRQYRKYLFPQEKGSGVLIYSQARVEDWEELEPVIMEIVESFQ